MRHNVLLSTDVYKMGHMEQYAPGTERVYAYLCARSSKEYERFVFFGLQYLLKRFMCDPVTYEDVNEFLAARADILGMSHTKKIARMLRGLVSLGYWPVRIKAVAEGSVLDVPNAVMSVESTHPEFYWAGGFIESLLMHVWYPTVVATNSMNYWRAIKSMTTLDPTFLVHDFGYRSDTTDEAAEISGAAHLIAFRGSDTVRAHRFVRTYYGPCQNIMSSVPATEHSVMCSYGADGELQAFEHLLSLYPTGYLSIVSDTYNIWTVCTEYLSQLRDKILARDGKVVIRPDSGNPPDVICGNPNATNRAERLGVLRLLDEQFGSTEREIDGKRLKLLNPKIGLIYGDAMYLARYRDTLQRMQAMGYDPGNLVIGCGGILRQGTRDSLNLGLKATQITRNGVDQDIFKSPIGDSKKKSHTGLVCLRRTGNKFTTHDRVSRREEETDNQMVTRFVDGILENELLFDDVRENFLGTA